MLTHLHIRNFKAWKDTGRIRLAPLTIIFGANSAGKSSLSFGKLPTVNGLVGGGP